MSIQWTGWRQRRTLAKADRELWRLQHMQKMPTPQAQKSSSTTTSETGMTIFCHSGIACQHSFR